MQRQRQNLHDPPKTVTSQSLISEQGSHIQDQIFNAQAFWVDTVQLQPLAQPCSPRKASKSPDPHSWQLAAFPCEAASCIRPSYRDWGQALYVEDASLPCAYGVFKPPPSDQPCDFSWSSTSPKICFVQVNLVFYFLIQFDLAYCVDRDTYYHVTKNLLDTSYGTITSTL